MSDVREQPASPGAPKETPAQGHSNPKVCGYLWKKYRKNKFWKGWHKRYFALTENKLLYFKNERDLNMGKRPRGEVTLGADGSVEVIPEEPGTKIFKFMVLVPPAGMIHLGGSSQLETNEWIKELKQAISGQTVEGSAHAHVESSSEEEDDEEHLIDGTMDEKKHGITKNVNAGEPSRMISAELHQSSTHAPQMAPNSTSMALLGKSAVRTKSPVVSPKSTLPRNHRRQDSHRSLNSEASNRPMSPSTHTPRGAIHGTVTGAQKHGILSKKKKGLIKTWQKRYFILKGQSLSYYRMDLKDNQNTLSKKCFRDNIILTKAFTVGYGQRDLGGSKKKPEWFPFAVMGPRYELKLAAKTQEEAQSWVEEIQLAIDHAPETKAGVESESERTPRRDHRPAKLHVASKMSPTASNRKRRGHHRNNTLPSSSVLDSAGSNLAYNPSDMTGGLAGTPMSNLMGSPQSVTSNSSPVIRSFGGLKGDWTNKVLHEGWLWKKYVRKKYWQGWHLRYFMLSGNCLQYFKDARKKKVLGSVVLGTDCCVDLPGTTMVVKKNKILYPFTVFLDGPSSNTPTVRTALLLATPREEDATKWTELLRLAVYGPQSSGDNTKFHIQDSDDEGEEREEEVLAVKLGEKIRLYTKTAYHRACAGGVIGIYRKPGQSDLFCVPPVGPAVAPELFEGVSFTLIEPNWSMNPDEWKEEKKFGTELRYGDKFQLADPYGRVWSNEGNYVFPKAREKIKAKAGCSLMFTRMQKGSRAGDTVHYGENNILIECVSKSRSKPVRNYKKSNSRLIGGYLNGHGYGKPIHFMIQRDTVDRRRDPRTIPATFEVTVINTKRNVDIDIPRLRISPGARIDLGVLYGGFNSVKVDIGESHSLNLDEKTTPDKKIRRQITLSVPELKTLSGQKKNGFDVVENIHDVGRDTELQCTWECKSWWKKTCEVPEEQGETPSIGIAPLVLAFVVYLQTLKNGDGIMAITIATFLLALFPILMQLRFGMIARKAFTSTNSTLAGGFESRGFWRISLNLRRKTPIREIDKNRVPASPKMSAVPNATGGLEGAPTRDDGATAELPDSIQGRVPVGSSLRRIKYSDPKIINSFSESHFHNFKLRCGTNYRKLKRKTPSKKELFSLLTAETLRTECKVMDMLPNLILPPETVDELVTRSSVLREKRPDLKIPPLFTVHLTWPNFPPPNPIWGNGNTDGKGVIFSIVFKLNDWIDDSDDPQISLLNEWINSPADSKYRERFKVLPHLVNADECKFEGLIKSIVNRFNGKPFLSRPQHCFNTGHTLQKNSKNEEVSIEYHNITIDGFMFPYLARSTVFTLLDRSTNFVIDMGFTIEAREDAEMPERVLGHTRMSYLDIRKFPLWKPSLEENKSDEASLLDRKEIDQEDAVMENG